MLAAVHFHEERLADLKGQGQTTEDDREAYNVRGPGWFPWRGFKYWVPGLGCVMTLCCLFLRAAVVLSFWAMGRVYLCVSSDDALAHGRSRK